MVLQREKSFAGWKSLKDAIYLHKKWKSLFQRMERCVLHRPPSKSVHTSLVMQLVDLRQISYMAAV